MQREIRNHFDGLIEEYRTDEGFEVPVAVKLASGREAGLARGAGFIVRRADRLRLGRAALAGGRS